jgi:hypothetical protein
LAKSLASSIMHSLDTLPHHTLVIDNCGTIQTISSGWAVYCNEYGLSPNREWVGANYFELLQESITDPNHIFVLRESLQRIFLGECLVYSNEFSILTPRRGTRVFRMEAFPFLSVPSRFRHTLAVSLYDTGPAKLVPICASCKSIRNAEEEWVIIERFLKQQLSMQFTHDICPDCIRHLYPKYAGALQNPTGD